MIPRLFAMSVAGVLSVTILSGTSNADLLLYEPFNYLGTAMSSTGVWTDNVNLNDPKINDAIGTVGFVTLSGDGTSLDYPGSAATQGSRVADTGGGTASRPLGGAGGIDLASDNTYYVSMLIRGSGILQFYYGPHTDNQYYMRAALGITDGGEFTVGSNAGRAKSANYSNGTYDSEETYLLVAKIDAHTSSSDDFSLKVYDSTMTPDLSEPASFDLSATVSSGVNMTYMLIGMTAGGEFDEIRVGTTWGDVSIPEPSSAALLLAAVLGACVTLRPRRRVVR